MEYKIITITTTHVFSDLVADFLQCEGSLGVEIKDPEEIKNAIQHNAWEYYEPAIIPDNSDCFVIGYFDAAFNTDGFDKKLKSLKKRACFETGSLNFSITAGDTKDYEDEWKKYYKPLKIGKIIVVPLWLKDETDISGFEPVYINPGMAFGTGLHETTAMVIELMQYIELQGKKTADVGCGSGILGISALKLKAKSCLFVDNDENAVAATNSNLLENALDGSAVVVGGDLLNGSNEVFDVVFANLTADLLKMLYLTLKTKVKENGKILISGIIGERESEIDGIFLQDFTLVKKLSKGEWRAAVYEKILR